MKNDPTYPFWYRFCHFGLMCLFGANSHAKFAQIFCLTVLMPGWSKKEGEQEFEMLV